MVYYDRRYLELYTNDKTEVFEYIYAKGGKIFNNITLRTGNSLKTAYGYGGYQFNTNNKYFIADALEAYVKYCKSQGVIKETILLDPFNTKTLEIEDYFDYMEYNRNLAVVELTLNRKKRYSQTTRNRLKKDIVIKVSQTDDIYKFMELYYATMLKNNAKDGYYFDEEYFKKIMEIDNVELYQAEYNGEVICMGIFFMDKPYASYHLSANTVESYDLYGNYYLLDKVFDIASKKGCKRMLLGGGRTTNDIDPLLAFKMKFTNKLLSFYILEKEF